MNQADAPDSPAPRDPLTHPTRETGLTSLTPIVDIRRGTE
jgi:hypothetical protein